MKVVITPQSLGVRADVLVQDAYPQLSRGYIKKLAKEGKISFEGKQVDAGFKPKREGEITVDYDLSRLDKIPVISLPVIYEDGEVLVIDKPEGIITHNRGRYWDEPSVASFIRNYFQGEKGIRAGIVHRLDRATSGVVICAKNAKAMALLQNQFANHTVQKSYFAVVTGKPKHEQAIMEWPIERHPAKPQTFRVHHKGKSASTFYKVLKSDNKHTLIELQPHTGRTHQLRVHLQKLGNPIVGDPLYGSEPYERMLLHAAKLSIALPNGEHKVFESPLPDIFERILES